MLIYYNFYCYFRLIVSDFFLDLLVQLMTSFVGRYSYYAISI